MKQRFRHTIVIEPDTILTSFIGFYFLLQAINLFMKLSLNEPTWWHMISRVILALLLAMALFVIIQRNCNVLLAEIVMGLLLVYPLIMNTFSYEYTELESTLFNFFLVYLPLGFALYSIRNMEGAIIKLYRFSKLSIFILYLTIIVTNSKRLFISSSSGDYSYSMALGYALLFHSLLVLDHFFETKHKTDLILVVINAFLILLFASRSPLLCLFFYVFIRIFKSHTVSRKMKKRIAIISLFVGVAVVVFYLFFAKSVYIKLVGTGVESTSLRKLLLNPLDDSNRMIIYRTYFDYATRRPIFGYGILGGWSLGTYPHNIVLEFILSFGFFIGIGLILWGIVLFSRGIKCKNKPISRMVCILLANNFYLLLSSSFLTSITFCMLIAACIKAGGKRTMCCQLPLYQN